MENILECKNLSKQYGTEFALDNVSLVLPRGRIVGLLGPNGSGKTTFIKIAMGLTTKSFGEILIDGSAPNEKTKAVISYLPDNNYLMDWMRISEVVEFYKDFYADFDAEKACEMLRRLNLKIDGKQTLKSLSKGMKEKVQLALTMSRNASLFLLDEPIGGVDPATRDFIMNTIIKNYNENATVLISTHLISDIESMLDDVIFISEGKIVLTSTVDDIREKQGKSVDSLFREVFKC